MNKLYSCVIFTQFNKFSVHVRTHTHTRSLALTPYSGPTVNLSALQYLGIQMKANIDCVTVTPMVYASLNKYS